MNLHSCNVLFEVYRMCLKDIMCAVVNDYKSEEWNFDERYKL